MWLHIPAALFASFLRLCVMHPPAGLSGLVSFVLGTCVAASPSTKHEPSQPELLLVGPDQRWYSKGCHNYDTSPITHGPEFMLPKSAVDPIHIQTETSMSRSRSGASSPSGSIPVMNCNSFLQVRWWTETRSRLPTSALQEADRDRREEDDPKQGDRMGDSHDDRHEGLLNWLDVRFFLGLQNEFSKNGGSGFLDTLIQLPTRVFHEGQAPLASWLGVGAAEPRTAGRARPKRNSRAEGFNQTRGGRRSSTESVFSRKPLLATGICAVIAALVVYLMCCGPKAVGGAPSSRRGASFSSGEVPSALAGVVAQTAARAVTASSNMPRRTLGCHDVEPPVVTDAMTYQISTLATWQVFSGYPCTVWDNESIWIMMRNLTGISIIVALVEFGVFGSLGVDPGRWSSVGTVLNVFVGLLISFFLTSSVSRWFGCVNGFFLLFNSIRYLQRQFHALGVRRDRVDLCIRYCVVSAWLLSFDLRHKLLAQSERYEARQCMWDELVNREERFSRLTPQEAKQLEDVSDAAGQIWTWVASLIGRMAQDHQVPPMASPTFGHIMSLSQRAQDGLFQVRACIEVRMPFVYIHTLASIVHLNNLLAAVSFGLTLGAFLGSAFARIDPEGNDAARLDLVEGAQEVCVQIFKCVVVPLLYHAFLEIGIAVAAPFSSEDGAIPCERMLLELEKDLHNANELASHPPIWEMPTFGANGLASPRP